jgi:SAM-dependent methyltransferase
MTSPEQGRSSAEPGIEAETQDSFAEIAPYYDALMSSVPYGLWADYVTELSHLAGRPVTSDSRLLDLATGTGSVALEFARRGCSAVGIDLSQPMIEEGRSKAEREHLPVQFICADLADFRLPPDFDHAICLYDSLNYILDIGSLKRAFANIRAALKPDGLLIFDVNTIQALEAELFTQDSPSEAVVQYRWRSRYCATTGVSRIDMEFRIPAADKTFRIVHRQRAYPESELRELLAETGFADITTYDGYHTTPVTPDTDRAFYVARAGA